MLNPETFDHVKRGNALFFYEYDNVGTGCDRFCRQIQSPDLSGGGIDASSHGFGKIAESYDLDSFMYGCTKLYRVPCNG